MGPQTLYLMLKIIEYKIERHLKITTLSDFNVHRHLGQHSV